MSTSIHNGTVAFATALHGTDDDPVSSVITRDGVANGLLHAADSMGQIRVNVATPDTSSFSIAVLDEYYIIDETPVANQWYRFRGSPFGSWPLTIHSDGTPYKLRVRIGVSCSSNSNTTQTIRVVIAPDHLAASERDREVDHVYEVSFNSNVDGTTPAWKAGTSQGTANSATLIAVSAADARSWTTDVSVYDAVSSATPRSIQQCRVSAHVFVRTSSASVTTRLHNLYIQEYCGT